MAIRNSGVRGCITLLVILFTPAIVSTYFFHSSMWILIIPLGIIALFVIAAIIPNKRKITPEQLADRLERHLLGTEGKWNWDDTTSVAVTDPRLDELCQCLPKFDSLEKQEDRDELKSVIASLRRGEVPKVITPRVKGFRARGIIQFRIDE